MSEAAYQRASLLFRAERMARDMERNYEELLYGDDQERQGSSTSLRTLMLSLNGELNES